MNGGEKNFGLHRGGGTALDPIDRACRQHDMCVKCARLDNDPKCHPYLGWVLGDLNFLIRIFELLAAMKISKSLQLKRLSVFIFQRRKEQNSAHLSRRKIHLHQR